MRNLKKVLSLSLALVMLLGMMVVGAGAAGTGFADDASIAADKKEAVAVLSAIQVIDGKENGFDPNGTLTRQEAATIIIRATQGRALANALGNATNCVFTDVADWAKGGVQYCYDNGIAYGMGGNYFGATQPVTGVQFATMMMRALGIEFNSTGAGWEANTIAAAARAGLSTGVTLNGNAMTRENAAQVAFNAITEYSPSGASGYTIPGSSIVFDTFIEAYLANGGSATGIQTAKNDTLANTVFSLTKTTKGDGFGRDEYVWNVDGDEVYATGTYAATPVVTYTDDVNATQIAKDLKGYSIVLGSDVNATAIDNATNANKTMPYTQNGAAQTVAAAATTVAAKIDTLTDKGVIVQVFANAQKECSIVVVKKTVGTLTADVSTRERSGVEQVNLPGVLGWVNADTVTGWEGLVKGDVVLYAADSDGVRHIERAEAITGVVTGTRNGALRVNGSYYSLSSLTNAATGWTDNDFTSEYTFYLDNGGYIVAGSTEAAAVAPTQYAVVLNNGWFTGSGLADGEHGEAQLLFTDGTTEIVTVSKVNGNNADNTSDPTKIDNLTNGKLVSYDEKDGKYELTVLADSGNNTLTTVAANASTGLTVTKGAAQMTSGSGQTTKHIVNNNTVFLVRSGASAPYTYTAYAGRDDVPSMSQAGAEIWSINGVARVVYITGGTASEVAGSDYVYIPGSITYTGIPNEDGNGIAYYEVDAIVNGEADTLRVAVNTGDNVDNNGDTSAEEALAANKLYKVVSKSATTDAVTLFRTTTQVTGVELGGGVLATTSDSNAYVVDADTMVYLIDEDGNFAVITERSDDNDKVVVDAANGTAKAAYIFEVPAPVSAAITNAGTATVTIDGAVTQKGNGKVAPTATIAEAHTGDTTASGTGTLVVTLKNGGNTVADNDTIVFTPTLPSGATIAVDTADAGKAELDTTTGAITLTYNSGWTSTFKVKVTNGTNAVTYTVSVVAANSVNTIAAGPVVAKGTSVTNNWTVTSPATVGTRNDSAGTNTVEVTVTDGSTGSDDSPASGDTLTVTLVAGNAKTKIDGQLGDGVAAMKQVTLTFTTSWDSATVEVTAEDGSYTTYTVSVQ